VLVDLSLREFVGAVASAVASTETPSPAGGSAAALSGACAAALLVLVCDVTRRHEPGLLTVERQAAERLQVLLLKLVDEDAAGYRAFLASQRGTEERQAAIKRVAATPLAIGRACADIVAVSRTLEARARGPVLGDVRAARHLAQAGLRTAVDLAEQNLTLVSDAAARQSLETAIGALRAALAR
jgi:formiminotetrahydrofolate cyclodeaminase